MLRRSIFKILIIGLITTIIISIGVIGCKEETASKAAETTAKETVEETVEEKVIAGEDVSGEVYYWGSMLSSYPMFQVHDHRAFRIKAEELGVQAEIFGPEDTDLPSFISSIETIAAKEDTAGMMMLGWGDEMIPVINEIVAKGIPLILVDSDIPDSDRLAIVGTNWTKLGIHQAKAMLDYLPVKQGTIGLSGYVDMEIMQQAFRGFTNYINENAPDINVLTAVDDQGSIEKAATNATDLITAYPDLIGLAGFDAGAGPGIATAVKEAGRAGDIIVTCVDIEPEHLQYVKEGVIQFTVGQKREFFTYYGLQLLYDVNHSPITFTKDDKAAGITNIPEVIETGFILVDQSNIDILLESLE